MQVTLLPQIQALIDEEIHSGRYNSAEDVVAAALSQLAQRNELTDFEPGEIERLLLDGEQSGKSLDATVVFVEIRNHSRKSKAG